MSSIEVVAIKHSEVPIGLAEEYIDEVSDNRLIRESTGDLAILGPFVLSHSIRKHVMFGRRSWELGSGSGSLKLYSSIAHRYSESLLTSSTTCS